MTAGCEPTPHKLEGETAEDYAARIAWELDAFFDVKRKQVEAQQEVEEKIGMMHFKMMYADAQEQNKSWWQKFKERILGK